MVIRILFGIVAVAAGLVFAVLFGQTTTLVCHRIEPNQIDCRLESHFLGIGIGEVEIHQLQSAEVKAMGDRRKYQVRLVTNRGNVPLTRVWRSWRSSKQRAADRINAFIANPSQPSFEFRKRGWFGLIFGCFFVFIGFHVLVGQEWGWFFRFLNRRMLPLAEMLDDRHFEMKAYSGGTMMSGLYHGRPIRFFYARGYATEHGSSPTEFLVALSCRSAFSFTVHKGRKRKRDNSSVEIGDPELDRQLVFRCDSPQSFTDWMGRPEIKEKIASLVFAERVASLQLFDDGFLGVSYVAGGSYVMGIALGSRLEEEMMPWNVTLVLQKLETLAQSVESIMGEKTSDDTA